MFKETRYEEKDVFITEDGKEFENRDAAMMHEKFERDQEILDTIPKLRSNRRPGNYYYITDERQRETVIRVYGRKYGDPYQIRELRKHQFPFVVAVIDPSLNANPKLIALPFTDFEADYKFFKLIKSDIEDALTPKRRVDADKTLLKDIILVCKGYYNQKVFLSVSDALGEYYREYISLYDVDISDKVIIMKIFVPAIQELMKKYPDRVSAKECLDFIVSLSLSDTETTAPVFEFFVNLFKNISFGGKGLIPMVIDAYIERGKIKNIVDTKADDMKEEDEDLPKTICTITTLVTNGKSDKNVFEVISGENATFTFTPNEGFNSVDVKVNGETVDAVITDGVVTLSLTKVLKETEVVVAFYNTVEPEVPTETYYTVTASAVNGTVDKETLQVIKDSLATFTFTPNEGYDLVEVTVNGEHLNVSFDDGRFITSLVIVEDTNIVATFSKTEVEEPEVTTYTVTASVTNGTTDKETTEVTEGEDITVIFTPNEGYDLVEATVNGNPIEATIADGVLTVALTDVAENKEIIVTFSKSSEDETGDGGEGSDSETPDENEGENTEQEETLTE